MINNHRTSRELAISGFGRPGVGAAALPLARTNPDDAISIDVDAPARAARRAEALARIRKRESAILRALGDGCPPQLAWSEIAIEHSAVRLHAVPAVSGAPAPEARSAAQTSRLAGPRRLTAVPASGDETLQPRQETAAALPSGDFTSVLLPDLVAVFPSLSFGFITAILACSVLAWLAVWLVMRFCQ